MYTLTYIIHTYIPNQAIYVSNYVFIVECD